MESKESSILECTKLANKLFDLSITKRTDEINKAKNQEEKEQLLKELRKTEKNKDLLNML